MPTHKPDLDGRLVHLRTPPMAIGSFVARILPIDEPSTLSIYVRPHGDGWDILKKRRCVEGRNHMPTHKPDLGDKLVHLRTPPMAIAVCGSH